MLLHFSLHTQKASVFIGLAGRCNINKNILYQFILNQYRVI